MVDMRFFSFFRFQLLKVKNTFYLRDDLHISLLPLSEIRRINFIPLEIITELYFFMISGGIEFN